MMRTREATGEGSTGKVVLADGADGGRVRDLYAGDGGDGVFGGGIGGGVWRWKIWRVLGREWGDGERRDGVERKEGVDAAAMRARERGRGG